ncbi:triose-phosphate isomerase [Desulfohalobium retbaense]|uniref:Pyruvate carboxyltransferase n=1 Tax=Desulfohalobium retbaense (strain ATCC 49708 / DSM 5692 / JCM 16813 / HR100) TaxID=485915 RepID=C8X4A2_DESRD|nr:cache domain-containing protein [Desulfohalobium retbaense]ACV69376.1 pyruvate carboxyltransferase [Desulfohalobium retbaense DSM 5692]
MTSKFLHLKRPTPALEMKNRSEPELFRDLYPYKRVSRTSFDDTFVMHRPAEPMFITDTTFRDGQQARPPYSVAQISRIYDMLHKLGGYSGLIRQCEFFLYSQKDRRAVETCLAKSYTFPEITAWIRANTDDLKLVRSMGIKETGMLTSVSDYHIYLKLGKDRAQAMQDYLEVIEKALEMGITPRCHFEDITRADIYGFCLPFARKLMDLSKQSGLPVKIRLCDTMGYGVPYPGAALPRSVAKIVRAFTDEAEVPGQWLEWHGHNDFHKGLINAVTAWLYGCSGANGTLLGFGERTGNAPVEALVLEYISLTGDDDVAYTPSIAEIADYFEKELDYAIPPNYPFVGRDFNATSAGIHVDGLAKNEEIYNIFDTRHILGRSVPIIITDKTGRAGVAYWINHNLELPKEKQVSKSHPAVGKIHKKIMEAYEQGRTTSFSHEEMHGLVKRYLPELESSEFDHLKEMAQNLATKIFYRLAMDSNIRSLGSRSVAARMNSFLEHYPFFQYIYLTDTQGNLITWQVSHPEDKTLYRNKLVDQNFSDREWFQQPMNTGEMHITDFYRSMFSGKLCLTISAPVLDKNDDITAILGGDIRFEELIKLHEAIDNEERLKAEPNGENDPAQK